MAESTESWQMWYAAQLQEQTSHKLRFPQDKPTLTPVDAFDPVKDAQMLRAAMEGLGTNEADIINILTKRTADQRNQIRKLYQENHGRDLIRDLKSDLSGIFRKVILSLMKPLPLFLAEQVKHATKGIGTNEAALIEIICTREDDFIKTIKWCFESKYDETVEKVVCSDTSGTLEKVLLSILSRHRDDGTLSPTDVADKLIATGVDKNVIRKIVTTHSFPFLEKVFDIYQSKAGHEFQELVEKKSSGDASKAFKAIYLSTKSKPEFYAHALHDAMKGFGTDDWALIRIIVSRCEIDLGTIKDKYAELYGKDLLAQVKAETSSDYAKALASLLGSE